MKKLGKYEILGELGHGAMGVVYRARDPIINRPVALKTITTGLADDPTLLQRFYKEAQSAGGLQHPNIVTIYDMGEEENTPYIAMELIEGESLDQVISRRENAPSALKLSYALQACAAFDYAHKRGIVHRDIKPGNVMVNKQSVVKVVDFGIARVLDTSKTQTGMLIGTFAYMSPEQYHGEHADERSDIWSFGVLLYELFCYQRPFGGENPASLMHSICSQEPRPLSERSSDIPSEMNNIISKILQKSPQDRYQSMEDLLLDLEPVYKNLQSRSLSDLINRSIQLIAKDEFAQARDLLRESLKIDSSSTQARSLLEKTNIELKRRQIRPRAQQHVDKGRALLGERKIQEARAEAENALALDSTLESARDLQRLVGEEAERARMVREWFESSKQRLAEGKPAEAEALLAKVLEIEPANKQAEVLRGQALKEEADRQKRLRLQEKMQEARALWTQQSYRECAQLLTVLQTEFPEEDEIARLLRTVKEDESEQYRQKSLEKVRSLRGGTQFSECQKLLLDLQEQFPNDDEISRLLQDVRLDEAKQRRLQVLTEARSFLAAGQYEESTALLSSLNEEWPGDEDVIRLLAIVGEEQAEQQKQKAIAEARKLLSARRYDECQALLTILQQQFPQDHEIPELLRAVREEQAEQRKLGSLAKVRSLLTTGRYEESNTLLVDLGKEFPGDEEIPRLLKSAREGQSEQRKLKGLAEAKNLLNARRYEDSISLLAALKREFPDEREIPRLLASASEEQTEQQKKQKLAEARSLAVAERFTEASTLLKVLSAEHPKDAAVQKLSSLVESELGKQVRLKKMQVEMENLRALVSEKKYSQILSREKALQAEFPGDPDMIRLVDFARTQQKQIERESRLGKLIEDVKAHSAASHFGEAVQAAQAGLKLFPDNSELIYLLEQAEIEQKKQRTREQIEQRIRQIKFKINRDKFSEAVDMAKDTLDALGPDTDVTQLLSSAQVEIEAREKKRGQERTLGEIRTLVESGDLDAAAQNLQAAIETQALDTFDARVQRVSQEIKDAKHRATATSVSPSPAIPPSFTKEYAFQQGPALEDAPSPADVSPAMESSPKAAAPVIFSPTPISPPQIEVGVGAVQNQTAPPIASENMSAAAAVPLVQPQAQPKPQPQFRTIANTSPATLPEHLARPNRRRQKVLIAVAAILVVALFWLRTHFAPASHVTPVEMPAEKPIPPPINPLAAQQRDALNAASQLVASNNLDGALQVLRQAAALDGPLTSDIQKKIAGIEESVKDTNLRALRQREEVLWQQAMNRVAARRYTDANKILQQIVSLPPGGLRRDDARDYTEKIIPQREKLDALGTQAQRSLSGSDFHRARELAAQIQQEGGDSAQLTKQIDSAESDRLSQLENQFNDLKQRDDDAAIQQLRTLQMTLQPLTASDWAKSKEAQDYLASIAGAISNVQGRIQSKTVDAAIQQTMQRCQRALSPFDSTTLARCRPDLQVIIDGGGAHAGEAKIFLGNINKTMAEESAVRSTFDRAAQAVSAKDKKGLEQSRSELQPITDGGGTHAREAKTYLDNVNNLLAALNQPVPTPQPVVAPKPNRGDSELAVKAAIQSYERAFEQKNVGALRQIWITLGDKQANALKETFNNVSSEVVRVQIDSIKISDDGTKATVNGSISNDVTPKGGNTAHRSNKATFELQNHEGSWLITEVR